MDLILGQFRSKNAKNVLNGLESQIRPFFYTVLVPEYGFYIKIPNFAISRSNLGEFGQKRANFDLKWPKSYPEG